MWRRGEELGFDHLCTYDHLTWGGLPDSSWYGTTPMLAAAALVTQRARLGTLVSAPNFRHPVTFARDILALDDLSSGRLVCGLGTGGDLDATVLGGTPLTRAQRSDRFAEFVELLDAVLRRDHVDYDGVHFTARDARSLPGCVQRPRAPFVVAANGPRAMRQAVRYGRGRVTTGRGGEDLEHWWSGVADLAARMSEVEASDEAADGAAPGGLDRYLLLDAAPRYSLESVDLFAEMCGRAAELGFTDVVTHWPRPQGPYAGSVDVLERAAADVLGGS